MRRESAVGLLFASAVLVAGCGVGTDGTSDLLPTSDPVAGIYAGTILDEDGNPVEGATVSIEGIQATSVTGPDGKYLIQDEALAGPAPAPQAIRAISGDGPPAEGAGTGAGETSKEVDISVLAPGYEPVAGSLEVAEGDRADVSLVRSALQPKLVITSPTGTRPFIVPTACANPRVRIEGYAKLAKTQSLRLDVAIVIDRSGSTSRGAVDLDGDGVLESVLEVERAAARKLLAAVDLTITRVAVLAFDDLADAMCGFTRDAGEAEAAVNAIQIGPPGQRGTNYEAAFLAASGLFQDLIALDAAEHEPADSPDVVIPAPLRAVVFLSDGIPTSHGVPRDPSDSNLTQSSADRKAAIAAAAELCASTGAQIYAFSIIPADDTNKPRTTLPHCVAACGGGYYENVEDFATLAERLAGRSLADGLEVVIRNKTTGDPPILAALYPDGFFSELVPVAPVGRPDTKAPRSWVNQIEVKLTVFSGRVERSAKEFVNVRLVNQEDLAGPGSVSTGVQVASKTVSELSRLEKPTGGPLGDTGLHEFLKSEFEDARELIGTETFEIVSPSDGGPETIRVDFVYKQACYKSDVGYVFIDPNDPPRTAEEALRHATRENILFNSGEVGAQDCNLQSIPAGAASREIQVPEGGTVIFFLIPNATLESWQRNPKKVLDPLFTLSSLNPGGFDQALTFRSVAGRTEPGSSTAVVSPGPLTVFAFEDISIAKGSDQDFTDVVFTVESVQGRLDSLECSP